jgi:N-dimethylarginine dimethylaminohydrolase
MPQIVPHVRSETGALRSVVVASPRHFEPGAAINVTQARYFATNPPSASKMVAEHEALVRALTARGIDVRWARELPCCPFQVNTRDVGVVVGDHYIPCRMRREQRAPEPGAVLNAIPELREKSWTLPSGFLEGGDVVLDWPDALVGVGERTDLAGCRALAELLGAEWHVHPIRLVPEILHLDVVLTLLPGGGALAYLPGILELPNWVREQYDIIEVTADEQAMLATNVLCIDGLTVVADRRHARVIRQLESRGLNVIALDVEHTTRLGGSFRCATLPLIRDH